MSEFEYSGSLIISEGKTKDGADGIRKMLESLVYDRNIPVEQEDIDYYLPSQEWDDHGVTAGYEYGETVFGYGFCDRFLPELLRAAKAWGYTVTADLGVSGDFDGIIRIRDNVLESWTFEDVAQQHWAAEKSYEARYRELVQRYFNDQTEEGRIDKNARMEEAREVLISVFGWEPERVSEVYNEEYAKKYMH